MKTIQFTHEELKFIQARLKDCMNSNEQMIVEAIDRKDEDMTLCEGLGNENYRCRRLVERIDKLMEKPIITKRPD